LWRDSFAFGAQTPSRRTFVCRCGIVPRFFGRYWSDIYRAKARDLSIKNYLGGDSPDREVNPSAASTITQPHFCGAIAF